MFAFHDQTYNLGMCPDWELNLQPFKVWDNTPTNWASQPGPMVNLKGLNSSPSCSVLRNKPIIFSITRKGKVLYFLLLIWLTEPTHNGPNHPLFPIPFQSAFMKSLQAASSCRSGLTPASTQKGFSGFPLQGWGISPSFIFFRPLTVF